MTDSISKIIDTLDCASSSPGDFYDGIAKRLRALAQSPEPATTETERQAKGYRLIRATVLADDQDEFPQWFNEALCMATTEQDFDDLCLGSLPPAPGKVAG